MCHYYVVQNLENDMQIISCIVEESDDIKSYDSSGQKARSSNPYGSGAGLSTTISGM